MLKAITDSIEFLLKQEMSRAVAPGAHRRSEDLLEQLRVAIAEEMFNRMPAKDVAGKAPPATAPAADSKTNDAPAEKPKP